MKIKKLLKQWERQLFCLHIYETKFIEKWGSIKAADVCIKCGKTKIIC